MTPLQIKHNQIDYHKFKVSVAMLENVAVHIAAHIDEHVHFHVHFHDHVHVTVHNFIHIIIHVHIIVHVHIEKGKGKDLIENIKS